MSNAAVVVSFLQRVAAGDVDAAFAQHVADDFRHHNPWFAQDRESLREAMKQSALDEQNKAFEVWQVIAEEDRVAVHSRVIREDGAAFAVVHIARLANGRIVELWDLVQPVPEDGANAAGMF